MELMQTIVLMVLIILLIVVLMKPEPEFKTISLEYYKNKFISKKLYSGITVEELTDHISAELIDLYETIEESTIAHINPWECSDFRKQIAAIVLAVTNMAEYYEIDLIEEMNKIIIQHEKDITK